MRFTSVVKRKIAVCKFYQTTLRHSYIPFLVLHMAYSTFIVFYSLAKLVRSRTYLDWPEDEGDREHFWDRLKRNIAEDSVSTKTSELMLQERVVLLK